MSRGQDTSAHPGRKVDINQTQLFVDPVEHINSLRGSVDFDEGGESDWNELWDRKLAESKSEGGWHGAGVYRSVEQFGVLKENPNPDRHGYVESGAPTVHPAMGGGWVQGEGHHRMAAAAAIQKETGRAMWVPVNYEEDEYEPEGYYPNRDPFGEKLSSHPLTTTEMANNLLGPKPKKPS